MVVLIVKGFTSKKEKNSLKRERINEEIQKPMELGWVFALSILLPENINIKIKGLKMRI